MTAVAKILWLIESRLGDNELSLERMADHAGISRFSLSRMFPLATGWSLSSYLRGRRLTEAAKTLASGAPDILGVALDVGYGSHEAFTRAFRDQFGMTPDELRRRRSLDALELVEPLRMDPAEKITLAPPVIEDRPAMRLAGLGQHYTFKTMDTIPHQWERFGPYIPELENGTPGPVFAVVGRMEDGHDGFDYFCCAAIPEGAELLPGLTEMRLPAASYARFRHEGHISALRATCAAVYETGLPAIGREPDTTWFSFLEYYGPDFEPSSGTGTVEVWVALKR